MVPGDDSSEMVAQQRGSYLRTPVGELSGHSGAVAAAEWLTGAELAITASWDRLAILHDVETCTQLLTLAGKIENVKYMFTLKDKKYRKLFFRRVILQGKSIFFLIKLNSTHFLPKSWEKALLDQEICII